MPNKTAMGKDSTDKPPRPTVVVVQQQQQKQKEEEVGGCMRCMYSCFGAFRVNRWGGETDHYFRKLHVKYLFLCSVFSVASTTRQG